MPGVDSVASQLRQTQFQAEYGGRNSEFTYREGRGTSKENKRRRPETNATAEIVVGLLGQSTVEMPRRRRTQNVIGQATVEN